MADSEWADPKHFSTPSAFRSWLEMNHDRSRALWIGFYRKDTAKGGLTYREALDEALCFGWIDGVRRKVDEERYTNRFSPRTLHSSWSEVNVLRYAELDAEGRIANPGRRAFARRDSSDTPERASTRVAELDPEYREIFERSPEAWAFFRRQPAGYRRTTIAWVMSAKKAETRGRRLGLLVDHSAASERVAQLSGQPARSPGRR